MSDSVYEKAFDIIKKRRMEALKENDRCIEEVNNKIPQIRVLNETLFNTSKELIKLISSGQPKDVIERKINQIKNDNIDAQKISANLLKERGYPEDYLKIKFNCPHCKDTGYVNSSYCECLKKLVINLKTEELNNNTQLKLSSFSTFRIDYYEGENRSKMKQVFDYSKYYAENFSLDSESLLFYGDTGVGKTHLSLAIANVVIQKGYSVVYDSVINILQKIEAEHFSYEHSSEIRDTYMNTDLLIIDDLGTEYNSNFYNATIYNIVNTRLNMKKPTIISTNFSFDGLRNRYEARVASRLTASYNCWKFVGEDIRLKINGNIKSNNDFNSKSFVSNNNQIKNISPYMSHEDIIREMFGNIDDDGF